MDNRIAIVGMDGIFPGADGLASFWQNLLARRDGAQQVPASRWVVPPDEAYSARLIPDHAISQRACLVDIPPLSGDDFPWGPELFSQLDPLFQWTFHAGSRAFSQANLDAVDRANIGVVLAAIALPTQGSCAFAEATVGRAFEDRVLSQLAEAAPDSLRLALQTASREQLAQPLPALSERLNAHVTGLPASMLAHALGLGGGSFTLDAACASSLYALKLACDELLSGRKDAMLAGGVSRPDQLYTQIGFSQLQALSPSGRCSPFDASADGLVVGEGVGIFVLKRLEDAIRAQDDIRGVICGIGLSNDMRGSLLAPEVEGQLRAMRQAYRVAGWDPTDVDLVECHGTGTPLGDTREVTSLQQLWREASGTPGRCGIGSVKSNIGHLLTAAAAAGTTKVLLGFAEQTLPPSANYQTPTPNSPLHDAPFAVQAEAMPWDVRAEGVPRRAAVSAFGFGGINAHMLLEEWNGQAPADSVQVAVPANGAPLSAAKRPLSVLSGAASETEHVPVAIVGMDVHVGSCETLDAFQELVFQGDNAMGQRPLGRWQGCDAWAARTLGPKGHMGAFLEELSMPLGCFPLPPNEMQQTLPQQLLMLKVAAGAMADAGFPLNQTFPSMGGLIGIRFDLEATQFHLRWMLPRLVASWARRFSLEGAEEQLVEWQESLAQNLTPPLNAPRTVGALGGIVASRVAKSFGLGGPCFGVSAEENAGLCALELGVRALQQRELSSVLVGAVDLAGDLRHMMAAPSLALDAGMEQSASFSETSHGAHIGEGAAALVLKRLEDVTEDERVYAVIQGVGHASRCVRAAGPMSVPDSATTSLSMQRAFHDAGDAVSPANISLVEARGAGSPALDAIEWDGLHEGLQTLLLSDTESERLSHPIALGSVAPQVGHTQSVSGLLSVVKTALSLHHQLLAPVPHSEGACASFSRASVVDMDGDSEPSGLFHIPRNSQFWLRDRRDGPRQAAVNSPGSDGCNWHVLLTESEQTAPPALAAKDGAAGDDQYGLFCVEARDTNGLLDGLRQLHRFLQERAGEPPYQLMNAWLEMHPLQQAHSLAVSLVAGSHSQALRQVELALTRLSSAPRESIDGQHGIFYAPSPLAPKGEVAFVYPGSGNHYLGMGRGVGARWPSLLRQMDAETEQLLTQTRAPWTLPWRDNWSKGWQEDARHRMNEHAHTAIFSQVLHGGIMTRLVEQFGIRPDAAIGYSLGESAALFALGVWPERGEMLQRMQSSALFQTELAGAYSAAKRVWGLPEDEPFDWCPCVFSCAAEEVRSRLSPERRVRLLIVNTPDECVVGGLREDVQQLRAEIGCQAVPLSGVVTVHSELMQPVYDAYRALHLFPTTPPQGVRFYSGYWGKSYDVTTDSAADSVALQALHGFDFTQTIERAYADGIRLFVEVGPRNSCTRMISKILGERSHAARSVCVQGEDDVFSVYQLLGMLLAHRVPVSLSPLLREVSRRDDLETLRSRPMIRVPIGRAPREIPLPSFLERAPAHSHTMSSEFSGVVDAVPEPISHFNEESGSYHAPTQEFVMPKKVQVQQESAQVLSEQWSPQPAPMAVAADPVGLGMVQDLLAQTGATAQAHEAYLAFSAQATQDWVHAFQVQSQMMMQLMTNGQVPVPVAPAASYVPHPPVPVAPVMPSYDTPEVAMEVSSGVAFDRDACMEFAIGSVGKVLGPMFAEVDNYPVRVRLPDEPLMLVDRIVSIEGEKGSMTSGSLVTEHDVHPGSWYLDGDCTPVCISVEAGQADLFLCSYLGIDLKVKGKRAYRLLDAEIHFHRELPRPGECIRYDISIEKFVRQGDVYLFFFQFDGTIDGQPLLTMRNGCAGFFTPEEVQDSGGILLSEEDCAPCVGKVPDDYRSLVPFMQAESYDDEQIEALRQGDIGTCFGPMFGRLPLSSPVRLPGGKMRLLHRVLAVEPHGGRFGLGFVRAQADIRPDDWFLTCHFVDDMVMPGTLMYECCAHTLRVLLMRMGWVGEHGQVTYEPVPGVRAALRCRGPVTRETKHVFYEVEIKEIGTSPEPYVIADAIMYADDKRVVSFRDMSMRLRGTSFAELQAMWRNAAPSGELALHAPSGEPSAPIYDTEQIMAYAVGRPSEGFGPTYRMFDDERIIARLPGPPYLFLDRVTAVEPMPWDLRPSGWIEGEYEVPADAWYFLANRQPVMPFGVLLEIVLQPCGWLAAYLGSGLHGKEDLSFRNLGGEATLTEMVGPDAGLLTTRVRMTHVSKAGGMIIQKFAMQLWRQGRLIYDGKTEFGFFTKAALSQQVGIVGANEREYVPTGTNVLSEPVVLPMLAPLSPDAKEQAPGAAAAMPGKALQMLDEVEIFEPEGGTNGLGFLRGVKYTDPDEWFFKAHFYQDPVCPGSLGLESFLQLLKYAAIERWGETHGETHIFEPIVLHAPHRWVYRGQILPRPSRIEVNADITEIVDGDTPMIKANGFLKVDGLFIYEMIDFGVRLIPKV